MLNEDNVFGFIIFGTISLSLLIIYLIGKWESHEVNRSVKDFKQIVKRRNWLQAILSLSNGTVKRAQKR